MELQLERAGPVERIAGDVFIGGRPPEGAEAGLELGRFPVGGGQQLDDFSLQRLAGAEARFRGFLASRSGIRGELSIQFELELESFSPAQQAEGSLNSPSRLLPRLR